MNQRNKCRKHAAIAAVGVVLTYMAQYSYKISSRTINLPSILSAAAFLCLLTGMIFVIVGLYSKTERTVFAGSCMVCGHFLLDLLVSANFTGFGGYSVVTNTYFVSRFIILLSAAVFTYMVYRSEGGMLAENMKALWFIPAVGALVGEIYYAAVMNFRPGSAAAYALLSFLRDLLWADLFLLLLAAVFFFTLRAYTLKEEPAAQRQTKTASAGSTSAAGTPKSRAKAVPPMPEKEIAEKLMKLKELLDEGIITEEEFTKKKKEYLSMSRYSSRIL